MADFAHSIKSVWQRKLQKNKFRKIDLLKKVRNKIWLKFPVSSNEVSSFHFDQLEQEFSIPKLLSPNFSSTNYRGFNTQDNKKLFLSSCTYLSDLSFFTPKFLWVLAAICFPHFPFINFGQTNQLVWTRKTADNVIWLKKFKFQNFSVSQQKFLWSRILMAFDQFLNRSGKKFSKNVKN